MKKTASQLFRSSVLSLSSLKRPSTASVAPESFSIDDFYYEPKKKFTISKIKQRFYCVADLPDDVKEELDKCIVLCRNCHKHAHLQYDLFEKFMAKIYYLVDNYKEPRVINTRALAYLSLIKGWATKDIARSLKMSTRAVRYHLQKIRKDPSKWPKTNPKT